MKLVHFTILCGIASALFASSLSASPFYVDLSSVANCAREDDGIADNATGGWSDEGINDMFLYPPVPVGEQFVNGYRFKLIDPSTSVGRDVVALRTSPDDPMGFPQEVKIDIPQVKGQYVYFIHNLVRHDNSTKNGDTVAIYSVTFDDGTSIDIPQHKSIELKPWWTNAWWENSEDLAWPIYIGRNTYTIKYHSFIGIWATRWINPNPDKKIVSITLRSSDAHASPMVWAVTIDNDNYYTEKELREKEVWGNPENPPNGFFDVKTMQEAKRLYDAAILEGDIKGVRRIDMIKPDLLAVTVDPAICGLLDPSFDQISAIQTQKTFTITSGKDRAYSKGAYPASVGRFSYEAWNGNIGVFKQNKIFWHTFYLQLSSPLKSGNEYTVSVAGIPEEMQSSMTLEYNERKTPSPAFKVNLVSYFPLAKERYAYLGWWAGDMGAVDFSQYKTFEVLKAPKGGKVFNGELIPRLKTGNDAEVDVLSGEKIYEINLSNIEEGTYRIYVPGLGCSEPFSIGGQGIEDLYHNTQRAFYYQRCGFPLEKPCSEFTKPACHLWVDVDGHVYEESPAKAGENHPSVTRGSFVAVWKNGAPYDSEDRPLQRHVGGYHDAADFDCFTYHLRATQQNLDAYDMFPSSFKDGDSNIPESWNGIPDLIDEAEWALRWYRDHQLADGGIPKGRCNDQDSRRQSAVKWGPYGIFLPDPLSNFEYAATAANFSMFFKMFNAKDAELYLESAKKAFSWGVAQPRPEKFNRDRHSFMLWAAATLYRATGDESFNDFFKKEAVDEKGRLLLKPGNEFWTGVCSWQYLRCENADPVISKKIKDQILKVANNQIEKRISVEPYRFGGSGGKIAWAAGNGGGAYADILLRAWYFTKEQKYLDGASFNADFQLGCNALSKTFMTGMGVRHPNAPQISEFLYSKPGKRGETVKGIVVFGITCDRAPSGWYPEIPRMRRYRDLGNGGAEYCSEFTITETTGANAMLYAVFHALTTPMAQ